MKRFKNLAVYAVILFLIGIFVLMLLRGDSTRDTKYSDILNYFREGKVETFTVDSSTLELKLKEPNAQGKTEEKYSLYNVGLFLEDVENYIKNPETGEPTMQYDLIPQTQTPVWVSAIPYVLIIIMIAVFGFFMFGQMNGGGGAGKAMSFSKARLKLGNDSKAKVMFKDVAGADEEKEELAEVVDFLKNPKRFTDLGARIPRGILMVGSPGTGKTYLARATAGEAGVPFFQISGSDFVELYVGVGASRVRDTFDQAKKNAPCIVFIDEIDAVGRQRGAGLGGGNDEREQTLNQLLVEMDGFEKNEGVIVMAATNRADILDNALLRPGRFDRQVYVGLPDIKGRADILKVHARGKPLGEDVDLRDIAKGTPGFSGADLENLLNEAALLAVRRHRRFIMQKDIDDAILKVSMGPEKKSRVITEKERRLTAYHESGHAIAAHYLEHVDPVQYITIIPRGQAGGFTLFRPQDDKSFRSRSEMFEDIVVALGGRIAEKIFLDDISTGASGDIQQATHTARNMVTVYGMSDRLGPISFDSSGHSIFIGRDFGQTKSYSEETAAIIDEEVKHIFDEAALKCEEILRAHADVLVALAEYLLINETIDGEDFRYFCDHKCMPPLPEKSDAVKQKEAELLKETETPAAPAENAEAKSEPDENKKEE